MKFTNPISSLFNRLVPSYKENKLVKHALAEIKHLIAHDDQDILSQKLNSIKGSEIYNYEEFDALLMQAIKKDNPLTFKTVLESKNADLHYMLYDIVNHSGAGFVSTNKSLLYTAIEKGSQNIALMLVADPRTDIESSGTITTQLFYSGIKSNPEKASPLPSNLDMAIAKSLTDIVTALEARNNMNWPGNMDGPGFKID